MIWLKPEMKNHVNEKVWTICNFLQFFGKKWDEKVWTTREMLEKDFFEKSCLRKVEFGFFCVVRLKNFDQRRSRNRKWTFQ